MRILPALIGVITAFVIMQATETNFDQYVALRWFAVGLLCASFAWMVWLSIDLWKK